MKKGIKFYIGFWVALLALFNVIAFLSVGWAGYEKYTPSFWIGYGFVTVSFIGQLICTLVAYRGNSLDKLFYKLPLIRISYSGLILSFVFGGACMLISPMLYWVSGLICAIIFVANLLALLKAAAAGEITEQVSVNVRNKTAFIKMLTVDAEYLMNNAKSDEIKAEAKKVYEAIRYSDPVSNVALASTESKIETAFANFTDAANAGNIEDVSDSVTELLSLIDLRNNKCKALK